MPTGQNHLISYHYLDCTSRRTGHRMRVAKVQEAEFLWQTSLGGFPSDGEVHTRKEEFLRRLEIQQAPFVRRVCMLHLLHDYPSHWDDVIDPLFVVETPAQGWQPGTVSV